MSADSLEIRLVRVESDIRRIDATAEPRFERIEKRLDKLDARVEALIQQSTVIDRGVALIISTCATKEELQREINAMTTRFIRWIAFIAGAAVAALKYLP